MTQWGIRGVCECVSEVTEHVNCDGSFPIFCFSVFGRTKCVV